ncbi:MAG: hypothetical protein AB1555_02720 [Nitrospirota bacterium]
MTQFLSSGVTTTATARSTKATAEPVSAVQPAILLSGKIAPTPTTVNKYFARSNSKLETFSRLLWCAPFTGKHSISTEWSSKAGLWGDAFALPCRRHGEAEVAVSAFNALNDKHKEHPLGDEIGSRVRGWVTLKF